MQPTIAERVHRHRAGLHAAGLRLVQIWVPDIRHAHFAQEGRRPSALVRGAAEEIDTLNRLEAVSDTAGCK